MDADRISHLQSEEDLKAAVTPKQGSIIPSFKPSPVAFQHIGETDPLFAVDDKPDNPGILKHCAASGNLVGLLTGQATWNLLLAGLSSLLSVVTLVCRVRLGGRYNPFCVRRIAL